MNSFVVVVIDREGNGFVELSYILVLGQSAKLRLETTKEAFHEAILPGTSSSATAQRNLVLVAGQLVFVAEVLSALVAVQDSGTWVFAQGVKQGGVCELGTVTQTQLPADDLASFEIQNNG